MALYLLQDLGDARADLLKGLGGELVFSQILQHLKHQGGGVRVVEDEEEGVPIRCVQFADGYGKTNICGEEVIWNIHVFSSLF